MKRSILAIAALLFLAVGARAQSGFTQVHAVVLDPTGVPYANCSGNAAFVPSPSATTFPTIGGSTFPTTAVIASCDSFGAFSLVLADNNFVVDGHTSPPASQWQFNILAQGGTPGFACTMTITGPTQNISAQIQACAAPLPSAGSNSFAFVTVQQSSTPSFISNGNTAFAFLLNQSVTSSAFITNAKPGTSPIYYVNPCQDNVGGHTMVWPSNVTLPANYVFSLTPNACSPVAFAYNPNTATWSPWMNLNTSGGGGTTVSLQTNGVVNPSQTVLNIKQGTGITTVSDGSGGVTVTNTGSGISSGAQGTTQTSNGASGFQAGATTDVGGLFTVPEQQFNQGPNPEVDVQLFGVRAVPTSSGQPFSAVGVNGACISGNTAITLSGAGNTRFLNGDGIVLYGCGTAHSMSTPAAPTVTSAIATANTGTGNVATNASAGAVTNRCYRIAAVNTTQGLTASSPEACITNGSANPGPNPAINITSLSRSGQTVTAATSTHTLPVGCAIGSCGAVYIAGTSDDINFSGWFPLNSVPNSTSFTLISGNSSLNGATTSATGGTFIYYNSDHLVFPAFGAGMWQYGIYEGASGAETLVDVSQVNVASLAGVPTYLTWDYYGSTYSGNSSLPFYWPTNFPTSATNNSLITTVVSGGGTANLVLAAAPSNTITGTALFDSCLNAQAANNFAHSFSGGGGVTTFPPVPFVSGGLGYVFNSNCTLTGNISQSMPIYLGDTMQFHGKWTGDRNPNGLYEISINGSIEGHIPINVTRAHPGILFTGGSMRGTTILPTGNNYVLMFYTTGNTAIFENMNFGNSNANDYNGISFYDFQGLAGGFGWTMRNVTFNGGPNQIGGASFTPVLVAKNDNEMHLDNIPMYARGMFFQPLGSGLTMSVDIKEEIQGLTEPWFSFYFPGGSGSAGWVDLYNLFGDTASQADVSNFGGFGGHFSITGANSNSAAPLVSGIPLVSLVLKNVLVPTNQIGQNINLHIDGDNTGNQIFDSNMALGPSNSFFTNTLPPAAPTCSTTTAGPPFTQAFTSSTFQYAAVFFNGGIGTYSSPSNSCSANGTTQQATLTIPAAIPGAIGYVINHAGSQNFSVIGGTCVVPATTSLTPILSSNCGGPLVGQTGGPAGVGDGNGPGQVWGDFFPNAPNNTTNSLPSFNGSGKLIATPCVPVTAGSLCDWNGSNWSLFAGNTTSQAIFEESAAGTPAWVAAPLGTLVGTGQSNTFTTGIQDFSAVTEFRPKSGLTSALPATCTGPTPMDVYIATDATAGQNWYFCTATNTWTQQLNSGTYALNTYSSSHTLLASEQWANFSATATATVPHATLNHRWVIFNTSAANTVTIAPDSGNITLNAVTAATASLSPGLGVQVACDGTNCFAWGLSSGGGGSGTVSSGTVNGPAYYTALTTVGSVTPPTTPNGVPSTLTSTPSGGVSQPPALSLPGIAGRAVSGIASTDTILSTDCNPNRVEYIGSVAVAVTLPTATTLGVPKCVFKLVNTTSPAQTVTIMPTTWTINGNSTLALTFGQQLWVYVDPNSATNWVADQTDLFGNVSGAAVPASAKLLGTNSSSQLIAAALSNTHIYVGNGSNLPLDVAVSGDETLANTGAVTVTGVNGATVPASAAVVGTNSSKQIVAATAHNIVLPWQCADSSGSGSAQVCNTSPTFTPVAGDTVIYTTTTANTGTALTVNVNSLGAKSVAKWQTTTTLAANDIRANTEVLLTYDGTNWELTTIGNAPSGGSTTPCTTTALSLQYNNAGAFGCVAEFTYASSTITASSTGKIDLTSASVTAGFHAPSAAGAAPTNGGIISYDQTCNNLVWGNAVNTSKAGFITSAATAGTLAQFSGTCGLLVSTTTVPSVITTPGTVTNGHLACYTSSGTVGNCTGLSSILGVFTSSTTWTASGETSVVLDATGNVTFGDNLCASPTSFGTAHDNGITACTTGLGIGIVKTTASSVSSATAFVALR